MATPLPIEAATTVMPYHRLDAQRIVGTLHGITLRIQRRFPHAGLANVAQELEAVAQQAAHRAEEIRRPYIGLRIVVGLLVLSAVAIVVSMASKLRLRSNLDDAVTLVEFAEAAGGTLLFLLAAAVFLFGLEGRWKRSKALAALHELRVLAHIIDMHQVSKQPERVLLGEVPTTRTLFELNRYLNYCTELLAIISKIASLYIQDFPDALAVTAVDDIETLCSGLANRIWQKLQVVDQSLKPDHAAAADTVTTAGATAAGSTTDGTVPTAAMESPLPPAASE